VERDVASLAEEAARSFEGMGHTLDYWDGKIPDVGDAWSKLMICDIYARVHSILQKIRPELNRTVAASVALVHEISAEDLVAIQEIRKELNRVLWQVFDRYDLLLTPAMPTEAFRAEGPPPAEIDGRPVPILWAVAFTYPFNLSGHPAATVRTGFTKNGLPAGLQIVGPRHREDLVLQAAGLYEQANPWNRHWPELQG
jgi:aspartyl-tRNA(Asn)/glutamyl-tRNA(Gln) amidotransferase subunit A